MLAFRPMMVNLCGRRCLVVVGDSLTLSEHSARQDQAAVRACVGDLLRHTPDARATVRKAHE